MKQQIELDLLDDIRTEIEKSSGAIFSKPYLLEWLNKWDDIILKK